MIDFQEIRDEGEKITDSSTQDRKEEFELPQQRVSGCSFVRVYTYPLAVAAEFFIGDNTVNLGIQGVVASQADIGAGMDLGAKLPDQYIARPDNLAAEFFDAAPLTGTVAAVS